LVGFYLYKLHSLAVEGNTIFEYRCLHVNPELIAYKNAFLKYADYLNTYPNTKYTPQDVKGFLDDYENGMRKYVPEEDKWLAMDQTFINRWDFQLIEPWYIKQGSFYQLQMYKGYRTDAANLVGIMDHPEAAKNLMAAPNTARQQRDDAINTYFNFFAKAGEIHDWRKYFGRVPIPKGCTEKNVRIPDTTGSLNWDNNTPNSTPSSVPIDPSESS